MVGDKDIYTAAGILIRQHGDLAIVVASRHIDEFTARDDLDGAAVWQRIRRAVRDLGKAEPDGQVN